MADEMLIKNTEESLGDKFRAALGCSPEEFSKKYKKYKKAEQEFLEIYDPFKAKMIEMYAAAAQNKEEMPKSLILNDVKLTYVAPSVRNSIDSKRLQEEEPELAKKYMKTTNVKASVRLG